MEAEIIAHAHCCWELFPIIDITKSLGKSVGLTVNDSLMKISVDEDNAGALILARTLPPKCTPRSKYYATKTICFCEDINKRKIVLLKAATVDHMVDLFNKGIPRPTFEYLQNKIIGW